MDAKTKDASIALPNIRLAKAFKFTADDIAANRQGFLSYRQRGINPTLMRLLQLIRSQFRQNLKNKPITTPVKSVCGRAKLEHTVINRPGRGFVFHDYWTVTLGDSGAKFHISIEQKHILNERIPYRVYFRKDDPLRILSLERVEKCNPTG